MSTRVRLALLLLCALALLAGACSSDDTSDDDGEPERGIVDEPTPGPEEATAQAELKVPVFEGEVIDELALEPLDCFNDYTWRDRAQNLQQATTKVTCDRAHERQLYLKAEHPAPDDQPYIGEPDLRAWTQDLCYEAFEEFIGLPYEQSLLEIGLVYPDLQQWGRDLERSVGCYVFAYEGGLLRGSMLDIGL